MAKKRKIDRDTELSKKKSVEDKLVKLYDKVEKGFIDQSQRADDQMDNWDMYNCVLADKQYYHGTSKIFVPIIYNAVNARATRFVNQLFPKGGRYVEVVSQNGDIPHEKAALLEHYVRKCKLRTEVAYPLMVNGDNEGQYNVYVSWSTAARHVTWKEQVPVKAGGIELEADEAEPIEEMKDDVILEDRPVVEVLSDSDVCILPATVNNVEDALAQGGSVTIIRRWTKSQVEDLVENGDIREDNGDFLLDEMSKAEESKANSNIGKHHADAAGIKEKGRVALGYETWHRMEVDGSKRLVRTFFAGQGEKLVLGCKLNPYWNDRCPLISVAVKKVSGQVKGLAPVAPCAQLQYAANDAINEGMDSAAYALLPIIATDPLKNPRTATMILDLAAVWEVDPNSTKFMQFPQLWKEAFEIVGAAEQKVFQTLGVNPAMIPQSTGGKNKRNQAEIANERQVDLLMTADSVTVLEEGVFTPILERFAEYDAQFRTQDARVRAYGYMGLKASMETVPPLRMGEELSFVWYGVEQAKNIADAQQQIAFLNVLRGIPPQQLPGRRINAVPALEAAAGFIFGHRIAPLVFEDISKQFTFPAEWENEHALREGHDWPVSPTDPDQEHIPEHAKLLKETGDPSGAIRQHIFKHTQQLQQKAMAQAAAQSGQPGTPGGAGKGLQGTPRPGGQVAGPRQNKGPAGMIAPDKMGAAGAVTPPRKM